MLEILVVLLVISIFSAVSYSPIKAYVKRMKFQTSVGAVKRLILTAKSRAVANPMIHCGVYFDVGSDPQRVLLFQDISDPGAYEYDPAADKPYQIPFEVPTGVVLSIPDGYPATLIFRGDGSSQLSARVVLKNDFLTDTLDVLASTGRVKELK